MKRTAKLLSVLFILIFSFLLYLFYINFDFVMEKFSNFVRSLRTNEVLLPSTTYNYRFYNYKTVSETTNFSPENIDDLRKIYYTVLNNGWNDITFYCDDKIYPNCINDVKIVADDKVYTSLINNYVSPFNTFKKYNTLIIDDNAVNLSIEKLYSDEEIKLTNKIIDEIIQKLNIDKDNVKISDIKELHNYLIKNITYDTKFNTKSTDKSPSKASYALVYGKAICSGYSDSFAIMMDKLNIPNFKVSSSDHIWNVIYFNNKWVHIDVTWDDDEVNKNNYYNFFMISTDDLLKKDTDKHTFEIKNYLELN